MRLEALRFAQGGVARKDFVPALQFFNICDDKIMGFNGTLALCSPLGLNLNCKPKAAQFIKAIKTCRDPVVSMFMTKNNRLAIKSGGFTAYVDCIEDKDYPVIIPEGDIIPLEPGFLETLFTLAPFIAEDASRPWARGILFRGQSAYATNNIIVIEKWLGTPFPVEINLPEDAVLEIMRIKEEPLSIQIAPNGNHATFHFSGDRWMRTSLYETKWPDVTPILDRPSNPLPWPDYFFMALEDLVSFTDDLHRVFFLRDRVGTRLEMDDVGASVETPGLPIEHGAAFNLHQLRKLERVATSIDFTLHPNPCLFFGDNLRGAIVGMRI